MQNSRTREADEEEERRAGTPKAGGGSLNRFVPCASINFTDTAFPILGALCIPPSMGRTALVFHEIHVFICSFVTEEITP